LRYAFCASESDNVVTTSKTQDFTKQIDTSPEVAVSSKYKAMQGDTTMKCKDFIAGLMVMIVAVPAAWGQSAPRTTNSAPAPTIDVEVLSAQELRDKPVYDGKSERIATVSEVTGTPGQMRQAILHTGGVLGVGGKEVALPLDKLSVAENGKLVLSMTHDQLKLLPRYR
jgi:hypothetical protein